ncbi:MAG: TIM barrel protein [Verrucomicrobiales bacterium]|nr:TIM barrel protein [Verrucomicrobiales bacterium]
MNATSAGLVNRRAFLTSTAGLGLLASLGLGSRASALEPHPGRLKQAVCQGVFRGLKLDLDGICRATAAAGAVGIDLVGPEAFPTLKKHGLMPTMVGGGSGIKEGINDRRHHRAIDGRMRAAIRATAEFGAPNVIVLAGDRQGISDEEGLENCVLFLNGIKAQAEDLGVTLCLELLNSKVNHPGYMCDHTAWGVELCRRVGSPRVKLLYDIYHMQIMEGDIIRTIRDNIEWIGHFHTAGNPGRHEFDASQELNYPAICKAIADTGFQGYLAHEYTPTHDPLETLKAMMKLCRV